MKITIQQYLFGICLLVFFAFNMLLLGGCNDDTEMEMIDSSQKNVISLSKIGRASCRERVYVLV